MIKQTLHNDKVIGIKYFRELFLKRKRVYPVSFFHFPIDTRKKSIALPPNLFNQTIKTYLGIYFGEFYYNDTPKYFPLSGLLRKIQGSSFFVNNRRGITHQGRSISWIWYLRPKISYFSNIKIKKQNGSTSRVLKLDNNYKANKDLELLPSLNTAMNNYILFK
jgi:hypothetical protein